MQELSPSSTKCFSFFTNIYFVLYSICVLENPPHLPPCHIPEADNSLDSYLAFQEIQCQRQSPSICLCCLLSASWLAMKSTCGQASRPRYVLLLFHGRGYSQQLCCFFFVCMVYTQPPMLFWYFYHIDHPRHPPGREARVPAGDCCCDERRQDPSAVNGQEPDEQPHGDHAGGQQSAGAPGPHG